MDSTATTSRFRLSLVATLTATVLLAGAGPLAAVATAQAGQPAGPIAGLWHTVLTTSDGSIYDR